MKRTVWLSISLNESAYPHHRSMILGLSVNGLYRIVDMPDKLFRRAKAAASLRGIPLKNFISQSVEHELIGSEFTYKKQHVQLPLIPLKQLGSTALTPERAAELLENGDLHVSTGH